MRFTDNFKIPAAKNIDKGLVFDKVLTFAIIPYFLAIRYSFH